MPLSIPTLTHGEFRGFSLKHISALTVNLSCNLEPVYSILIAMVLFDEARELNASFWTGLALIGLSVLLQTVSVLRQRSPLTLKEREFTTQQGSTQRP